MENFSFLFDGISEAEWKSMQELPCMRQKGFEKGTVIFRAGSTVSEIGAVRSGSVNIESNDFWGNRSILSNIPAGQIFAETYALCREPLMVDVTAAEHCEILFFNLRILTDDSHAGCSWQHKLIKNILYASVQKNMALSRRIFCTTPKSIRARLLTYLSYEARKAGCTTFRIPFNRQQLADYLNLDRSALSKELGHMRKEGLLEFHKNQFTLKDLPLLPPSL